MFQNRGMSLYRYQSPEYSGLPILLVYSLVNRPQIADLQSNCSLVKQLIVAGYEVYLYRMGDPIQSEEELSLKDHILVYLGSVVNFLVD